MLIQTVQKEKKAKKSIKEESSEEEGSSESSEEEEEEEEDVPAVRYPFSFGSISPSRLHSAVPYRSLFGLIFC